MIAEGHIIGAGSIGGDAVVIMVSPSGQISAKKVVYLYPTDDGDDENGILEFLLSPLPGDTQEEKMMALAGIGGFFFVLFFLVILVLKRSHREEDELEVSAEGSDLELLIDAEKDDGPLFAIDTDDDSELLVSVNKPKVVLDEDEDEPRDLSAELEAQVEAGTASKRLERRMKRKDERETQDIFVNISKNLPPLPAPGTLPVFDAPILSELPPLPMPPAPGALPMPPAPGALPLPALGNLPPLPLPAMPAPERTVTCAACGAGLKVKDMTLRKMDCPICSEVINM